MTISPTCVTIDCADPRALAEFWNEAFGWGGVAVTDDGGGAICGPPAGEYGGLYLEFIRVPEGRKPEGTKNRLHLGCGAAGLAALDTEIDRLLGLGASIAWEEEFDPAVAENYRNVVLRDPEGNEFCLGGGDMPAEAV